MAWEPESVLRFLLLFFAAQMLILWLLLPFAIYGIKRRMESMLDQNREFLKEVSQLRRTLETLPGATRVGRRLVSAEEQKVLDEDEASLAAEAGAAQTRTEPKVTSKASKDSETKKRDGAASLIEQDNLPEEGDEEYDDYDDEPPLTAKPEKVSNKKKQPALPPVAEEEEEPVAAAAEKEEQETAEEPKKADKDKKQAAAAKAEEEAEEDDSEYADDSADYEDDSIGEIPDDEELHAKLVDLPMKSKERKQLKNIPDGIIVDIPPEDEISEDDEGYFIYRGEKFEHLIDAMRQQQIDAQAERAEVKPKKTG